MPVIQNVPERIAYLVLLFLHQKLTSAQYNELNQWVAASSRNSEMFEELIAIPELIL